MGNCNEHLWSELSELKLLQEKDAEDSCDHTGSTVCLIDIDCTKKRLLYDLLAMCLMATKPLRLPGPVKYIISVNDELEDNAVYFPFTSMLPLI